MCVKCTHVEAYGLGFPQGMEKTAGHYIPDYVSWYHCVCKRETSGIKTKPLYVISLPKWSTHTHTHTQLHVVTAHSLECPTNKLPHASH